MVEIDIGLQLLSPGKAFFTCDSSVLCAPGKCSAICLLWYRERTGGGQSPPPPVPPGSGQQNRRCAVPSTYPCRLRAEAASMQNTALSPHPCGLPRPSGNVSAILRPPTPAVSARKVNKLTAGRTNVGRARREPPPGIKATPRLMPSPGGAALARAWVMCACRPDKAVMPPSGIATGTEPDLTAALRWRGPTDRQGWII